MRPMRPPRRDGPREHRPLDPAELEERRRNRLSKFLALVLRHRATQFELDIDEEGFVDVEDLLDLIHEQDGMDWVTHESLETACGTQARKRFEIRDGAMRATYGHSFPTPVRFEVIEPPEFLYVGMAKTRAVAARREGVQPDGRQYVHLTDDHDEAMEVGKRQRVEADVVTIKASEAAADGLEFYKPTEGLFLSGPISPKYIETTVRYGRRSRKGRRR